MPRSREHSGHTKTKYSAEKKREDIAGDEIRYSPTTIQKTGEKVQHKDNGLWRWLSCFVTRWAIERYGHGNFFGALPYEIWKDHFVNQKDQTVKIREFMPAGKNIIQLLCYDGIKNNHSTLLFYDHSRKRAMIYDAGKLRTYRADYQHQAFVYCGINEDVFFVMSRAYEVQKPRKCAYHSICSFFLLMDHKEPVQFIMQSEGIWNLCKAIVEMPHTVNNLSLQEVISMIAKPRNPPVDLREYPLKWLPLFDPNPSEDDAVVYDSEDDH